MKNVFLPGEEILDNSQKEFTYGLGTYETDNKIKSSLFGAVKFHNRIVVCESFFSFKYFPNVGDVIIGRVVEISNKKWKIACNSINEATLSLGSVLMPGVAQRIKDEEDEMEMHKIYGIGDVIICEVQKTSKNGLCTLHSRSSKYGKLTDGLLLQIPYFLIKKQKSIYDYCKIKVFVGSNGFLFFKTSCAYNELQIVFMKIQTLIKKKEVVDLDGIFSK
ncbi:EXOSC2 [Ecytonucleospora hepatopenaei]|uniref:EXOSC2 n=1 Tax=Ecytonucleospora hepatopenaei TaxID=646526 RepID=A0A1W0E5W6_9MICR|nr:EXOSC2 [Ecytonucleospora hepatopenaei]